LETYPYTFFSRYGEKPGTNLEELLGAAHAACFKACAHSAHQRNQHT
jgi:organic hydroperoxide reductase OsmC/OhrA